MPRAIITGGPGAGKSTLLAELAALGFAAVAESARSIIAERLADGQAPRPAPLEFANEILRRDIEKYLARPVTSDWVFFDRGVPESLAMVHELSPLPERGLQELLSRYAFHRTVFILPPWEAIYATDVERDHSFAHAQSVHAELARWYPRCGYRLHEVPRADAPERARHVLQALGLATA